MHGVPEGLKQQWCDKDEGEWFVTIDNWGQVVELLPLARGDKRSILTIADRQLWVESSRSSLTAFDP